MAATQSPQAEFAGASEQSLPTAVSARLPSALRGTGTRPPPMWGETGFEPFGRDRILAYLCFSAAL